MSSLRMLRGLVLIALGTGVAAAQSVNLSVKQRLGSTGFSISLPQGMKLTAESQLEGQDQIFYVVGPLFLPGAFGARVSSYVPPNMRSRLDAELSTLFNMIGGTISGFGKGGTVTFDSSSITRQGSNYYSLTKFSLQPKSPATTTHGMIGALLANKKLFTIIYQSKTAVSSEADRLAEAIITSVTYTP